MMSLLRPTLIFDFGNVICHFDFLKVCDRLGQRVGQSGQELLAKARSSGFTNVLKEYESGRMESRAFAQQVCQLVGVEVNFEEFVASWSDIFWLNDPVAKLALRLKDQGYRLLLGSNTNELHASHFIKQFDHVLSRFDHLVLSHQVGSIKPEQAFFQACVKAAQTPAEDCLFIDDVAENVEGARQAGLQAFHYQGDNQALEAHFVSLGLLTG